MNDISHDSWLFLILEQFLNVLTFTTKLPWLDSDLEKAASSASGACGHFVLNTAILRTSRVKNPAFLTEDKGRRVEDGKLRLKRGKLRMDNVEWRNDNSEMRLEGCGLRIENQDMRILPCYNHI